MASCESAERKGEKNKLMRKTWVTTKTRQFLINYTIQIWTRLEDNVAPLSFQRSQLRGSPMIDQPTIQLQPQAVKVNSGSTQAGTQAGRREDEMSGTDEEKIIKRQNRFQASTVTVTVAVAATAGTGSQRITQALSTVRRRPAKRYGRTITYVRARRQ